jgi:hypothetical protein
MGRRKVYGFGDRGIKNRAALEQSFMLWLTILVAIPVAIMGFVADNFVDILRIGAICAAYVAVSCLFYKALEAGWAYLDKLSKRVWANLLARLTARWR